MEEKKHRWSNAPLTKEQWVARAKAKYGDKFDYSESEYLNGMAPILIRCKKHDLLFRVIAGNFINKNTNCHCPICLAEERANQLIRTAYKTNEKDVRVASNIIKGIKKGRLTASGHRIPVVKVKIDYAQSFIEKAKMIYGDKYDYSKVIYKNREEKVTIICKEHGEFQITPRAFVSGDHGRIHGCPVCEGIKVTVPYTKERFIEEMNRIYGKKLKFNFNEYKGLNYGVTAICPKHGEINHKAAYWLSGKGCDYCNGKFFPKDFVKLAKKVHGDKYDYSKTEIPKSQRSKVTIICPEHGEFKQFVCLHLSGCKCPSCAAYPNRLTKEERGELFIQKAKERYGNKFDYSKVNYVNNDTPVEIYCNEHHVSFMTTPDTHIRKGSGACPNCVRSEGEALIYAYLSKHSIKFHTQFKLEHDNPKCKRTYLIADFYLPDYNMVIEFNGIQHYKSFPFFNNKEWTLEDQQIRDATLVDVLQRQGIRLLVIKYDDINRIQSILKRELQQK